MMRETTVKSPATGGGGQALQNPNPIPAPMSAGDNIWVTSGGRTTKGHVTSISEDGLFASISFDGVLSMGGLLFSTMALARSADGGWQEDGSGAVVDVAVIRA